MGDDGEEGKERKKSLIKLFYWFDWKFDFFQNVFLVSGHFAFDDAREKESDAISEEIDDNN